MRSNWQLIEKVTYTLLLNGAKSGVLILTPQKQICLGKLLFFYLPSAMRTQTPRRVTH